MYDFQKFKTKTIFAGNIFTCIMTLNYALQEQISLKDEFNKFNESTKQKNLNKNRKILIFENANRLIKRKH